MTPRQHPQSDDGQRAITTAGVVTVSAKHVGARFEGHFAVSIAGEQIPLYAHDGHVFGFPKYGRGALPHEGFSLTEAQIAEWHRE